MNSRTLSRASAGLFLIATLLVAGCSDDDGVNNTSAGGGSGPNNQGPQRASVTVSGGASIQAALDALRAQAVDVSGTTIQVANDYNGAGDPNRIVVDNSANLVGVRIVGNVTHRPIKGISVSNRNVVLIGLNLVNNGGNAIELGNGAGGSFTLRSCTIANDGTGGGAGFSLDGAVAVSAALIDLNFSENRFSGAGTQISLKDTRANGVSLFDGNTFEGSGTQLSLRSGVGNLRLTNNVFGNTASANPNVDWEDPSTSVSFGRQVGIFGGANNRFENQPSSLVGANVRIRGVLNGAGNPLNLTGNLWGPSAATSAVVGVNDPTRNVNILAGSTVSAGDVQAGP